MTFYLIETVFEEDQVSMVGGSEKEICQAGEENLSKN